MNSITLIGRLGKDPESRQTKNDKKVTEFSLAVQQGFGEKAETVWYSVEGWNGLGERMIAARLKKGSKIVVVGQLAVKHYEKKSGDKAVELVVTANDFDFADSQPKAKESAA